MTLHIKTGDEVQIIAGKDLGARGRVLSVIPKKNMLFIEGVNRVTRHEKLRMAQGRAGQEGGIQHKEAAVHVSNVALVCPNDGPVRAGMRVDAGGERTRVCKKCGTEL